MAGHEDARSSIDNFWDAEADEGTMTTPTAQHSPADSIASFALDCGYNDPGYFARVFKQEYGMTPQDWRAANDLSS